MSKMRSTYISNMGGFLFSICLFVLPILGMAQDKKVDSFAFRMLLNSMLKHDVREILIDSAYTLHQKGEAVFLDARERGEYEVSHIKEAKWVGFDDFKIERVEDIKKSSPVVVYCSIGARSEKITRTLKEQGFTQVYNLYGGIFEWVNKEYPIYKEGKPTDSVHGYSKMWSVWLNKGTVVYE
ncbi:rhodanese-like domain-containing protein [Luteibaculum oceani]|uniref:Rhodanese-like domain-containing protein n=1 Tax=Luteibaculum oceani TaxID=1294296 RepID=A0A5C6UZ13_9FLAO|nr:rhodanese-like domain-containing protein [Luteibaculum oceani]TXC76218.1 rhodanese-like domain-containing protein [Luteibaculum oceani]